MVDEFLSSTWEPAPPTPGGMTAEAAAVVKVRYTGDWTVTPLMSTFHSNYSFELLEVVKPHWLLPNVTQLLTVRLPGGRRETATHIIRQLSDGWGELIPQHTYVIFLQAKLETNRLYPAWGAAAFYDITSSHVRALDRSMAKYDSMSVAEFVGQIAPQ